MFLRISKGNAYGGYQKIFNNFSSEYLLTYNKK